MPYHEDPADIINELRAISRQANALYRQLRELLTASVLRAAREGISQRAIAAAIGRSQPEVCRLLRFAPRSDIGRRLVAQRKAVLDLARDHGVTNVRVFGSTARGEDHVSSDLDLLVDVQPGTGLFQLGRLEHALSILLDVPVDVVPASSLKPRSRSDGLNEAIPL